MRLPCGADCSEGLDGVHEEKQLQSPDPTEQPAAKEEGEDEEAAEEDGWGKRPVEI